MVPLSISNPFVNDSSSVNSISRGNHQQILANDSKVFSRSPNSSSSSISSSSANSTQSSASLDKSSNIFIDINNLAKKKNKNNYDQLFFNGNASKVSLENNSEEKYDTDLQKKFERGQQFFADVQSSQLALFQQQQHMSNMSSFNNVSFLNNPFLQNYYLNLASKSNNGFAAPIPNQVKYFDKMSGSNVLKMNNDSNKLDELESDSDANDCSPIGTK